MKTLLDLDISKDILKKKKIKLYKAFILKDGDEMKVDVNSDLFSLSKEAAVQHLITSMTLEEANALENTSINFAVFNFDKEELTKKPLLIDADEVYFNDDSLLVSLSNKLYKIDIIDEVVSEIEIDFNPTNEIKSITKIIFQ